jgi:transposase
VKTNLQKLIVRLLETKSEKLKLGIDVHARELAVSIQIDDARALRPQMMKAGELLELVKAVLAAGREVFCCYECGPCGYSLYWQLKEAGVKAFVIVAELLGDGRKQKTDKLDAAALTDKLDRYLRGNTKAMTPITVPTLEQQQRQTEARLRGQLKSTRHQWEARGRSLLLLYGYHVTGRWWTKSRWAEVQALVPAWLSEQVAVIRTSVLQVDEQEKALRVKLEAEAPKRLPKAFGALTWVLLAREICSWKRFNNRRQVSSYTGLCPGVHQSGERRREGSINRYGNRRVRALLIELVWRLARWQPDYPPVRALVAGIARGAARRKCAVAAARRLAVDLWRLATEQTTPEKLHLIVPTEVLG